MWGLCDSIEISKNRSERSAQRLMDSNENTKTNQFSMLYTVPSSHRDNVGQMHLHHIDRDERISWMNFNVKFQTNLFIEINWNEFRWCVVGNLIRNSRRRGGRNERRRRKRTKNMMCMFCVGFFRFENMWIDYRIELAYTIGFRLLHLSRDRKKKWNNLHGMNVFRSGCRYS